MTAANSQQKFVHVVTRQTGYLSTTANDPTFARKFDFIYPRGGDMGVIAEIVIFDAQMRRVGETIKYTANVLRQ